ncbi:hypothetical protein AB0L85_13590 [Streptomyces sp. NPDC052051]|uniref:hypothetical protein n=1 Tax=Streptomyces sp. NPDC052051 TaxID=3154649 RepID=UPI003424E82A
MNPAVQEKKTSRRRMGRMIGAGLLAVAVVGGVAFTVVRVDGADRDAGKPVWKFPATAKHDQGDQGEFDARGNKDTAGLRALLMPYSHGARGYGPGPDVDEFGNDAVLDGREATALAKRDLHGMPQQTRRKLEGLIDKKHIQGMALRSYAPVDDYEDLPQAFTISFRLVRMEGAREDSNVRREAFESLGFFPKGPSIDGHKEAACFLWPKVAELKLDRMVCTAYVGDVLVTVDASGIRPLGSNRVAVFIGNQLDRIKDTGKAI